MTAGVLEALVGGQPAAEMVAAALTTIPAAELPDALRGLVRAHGEEALPVLTHCLGGRPEWAIAAAQALGTLPAPAAAKALQTAESRAATKAVRTAVRRALYRLRQAGVAPSPPTPRAAPPRHRPTQAWMSAVDGTGTRGVWLLVAAPLGERSLLTAVVSDQAGVLDFAGGPITKRRLVEHLRARAEESPLPFIPVPPDWAWGAIVRASEGQRAQGARLPGDLERWLRTLGAPDPGARAPIDARFPPDDAVEPGLVARSAELLALPECGGWFLDPASVQAEALDLLQARESRLVVSDQIRAERAAALVDQVSDAQFDAVMRARWQARLEEQALVLLETGRAEPAHVAVATARALADPGRPARYLPFVRALAERGLEVAGEVALGRLPAAEVSRVPRGPARVR